MYNPISHLIEKIDYKNLYMKNIKTILFYINLFSVYCMFLISFMCCPLPMKLQTVFFPHSCEML